MSFLNDDQKNTLALFRDAYGCYENGFLVSTRYIFPLLLELRDFGLIKVTLVAGESCRVFMTEVGKLYVEFPDLPIA